MAVRRYSGVTSPQRLALPHTHTAQSSLIVPGEPHSPNASRHQFGITATSRQVPSQDLVALTICHQSQTQHTATQRPGGHHTVRLHKKLSMCYTSLYFLLSSAVSCLWSPATSSPPLLAHLLLLPPHVSFHSRRWSIVCLEESRVSFSSPADVWQLPAYWHVSYSQRPLFVSLPV